MARRKSTPGEKNNQKQPEATRVPMPPALIDWDSFCHDAEVGVFVETEFEDISLTLPKVLKNARENLRQFVPDEKKSGSAFNAPRYCIRRIERELRKEGERRGCKLVFGPSDYRTFLVTNGLEDRWVEKAGLESEWENKQQWVKKWTEGNDTDFFENSFGINILVTALGDDGKRYAFFNERGGHSAVLKNLIVASVDEGLRRAYKGKLFDERSEDDPTPDITAAAKRALWEEMRIGQKEIGDCIPVTLSVGRVMSVYQPAVLIYWPLNISVSRVADVAATAPDRKYEFGESQSQDEDTVPGLHVVPFERDAINDFIRTQEEKGSPFASWIRALVYYSFQHVEANHPPSGEDIPVLEGTPGNKPSKPAELRQRTWWVEYRLPTEPKKRGSKGKKARVHARPVVKGHLTKTEIEGLLSEHRFASLVVESDGLELEKLNYMAHAIRIIGGDDYEDPQPLHTAPRLLRGFQAIGEKYAEQGAFTNANVKEIFRKSNLSSTAIRRKRDELNKHFPFFAKMLLGKPRNQAREINPEYSFIHIKSSEEQDTLLDKNLSSAEKYDTTPVLSDDPHHSSHEPRDDPMNQ